MSNNTQAANRPGISPAAKMSFAVSACAFAAAAVGLLVNQWMSGWMAVGGMTGVGLFYLAIGLLNLNPESVSSETDLQETAAHRLSGAGNVDDRAVERTTERSQEKNLADVSK